MLADYIRANPSLDNAAVLSAVNSLSVQRTDSTPYTWSGLSAQLSLRDVSAEAIVAFEMLVPNLPGGSLLDKLLTSGGADFTLAPLRAALAAAASAQDADGQALIAAVLSVGVWHVSPWQAAGNSGDATLEEVQAARAAVALDTLRRQIVDRYNAVIGAVDTGAVTDWTEARAALGAE